MLHCCALWLGEGPLVVACSCRHRCCMLLRLVGDGWRIARDDVEQHLETEDPAGNGIRYPFANFKLTHDHQRGQSTSKGLLALYEPSSSPCRVFGPGFKRFLFEITVGSARLAPPPIERLHSPKIRIKRQVQSPTLTPKPLKLKSSTILNPLTLTWTPNNLPF